MAGAGDEMMLKVVGITVGLSALCGALHKAELQNLHAIWQHQTHSISDK